MAPRSRREALECGRLRPAQHAAILLVSLAMIFSGAALWYIRHILVAPDEDFSVFRHPSEPWWLWLHALAAPPFLVAVGSSAYSHMKRHFEAGFHRASGVLLVALVFVMTYSGYLLYLVGSEGARKAVLWTHLASGAAFVFLLAWHIVVGRLAKRALDRNSECRERADLRQEEPRRSVGALRRLGRTLLVAPVLFVLTVVLAPAIPRAQTPPADGSRNKDGDALAFGPVKLGVDAMTRAETIGNFSLEDFSYTPGDDDSRIVFRVRPSVTVSPSEFSRIRVEGQWYAFYDDADSSLFTLYQGYVEGSLLAARRISVRAGRQELSYGSDFLLGADTFFDGLSFDAVKLSVARVDGLSLDLFGGRYAKQVSGGIEGTLYGAYATYAVGEDLTLDLFGLRDTGDDGLIHVGGDHEQTWSVGTRVAGSMGKKVSFEVEPIYQFGRKNRDGSSHDHIRAFGGHADLTVDPAPGRFPGQPFLSYAFGSGDDDPETGTFREFHNPNNDTALVGDIGVIGDLSGISAGDVRASGLRVVTVGYGVDVTDRLNVSLDGHWFRAVEVPDGFSRDVGVEANLILTYAVREKLSVTAALNRFFTGDFFKDATGSGKDIDYAYLMAQATF